MVGILYGGRLLEANMGTRLSVGWIGMKEVGRGSALFGGKIFLL
jgi:hypothetical protein